MKKTVLSAIPVDQRLQEPIRQRTQSFKVAHNLLASFRYAWAGVSYAFVTQRNFRIHAIIGSIALGLGLYLGLPPVELAVVGITSGLVLVMELLNTALEAVVDLTVSQTYHELAKIAKDCAAASVLISALVAVIVAGLLLFPPLWVVLSGMMV
ncbi:MAG: diacylglycerol kinase [Thermosynechococcaceae cyanobacterium]